MSFFPLSTLCEHFLCKTLHIIFNICGRHAARKKTRLGAVFSRLFVRSGNSFRKTCTFIIFIFVVNSNENLNKNGMHQHKKYHTFCGVYENIKIYVIFGAAFVDLGCSSSPAICVFASIHFHSSPSIDCVLNVFKQKTIIEIMVFFTFYLTRSHISLLDNNE